MTDHAVADTAVSPLAGELPPDCQRDVNALRRFIHDVISEEAPSAAVPPTDVREVLLTGVTGFIGRFFLYELLRQDSRVVVHCLVRAEDSERGFDRVRQAMSEAEIWDDDFAPRIRAIPGDIGLSRFGLDDTEFDSLCGRIDAIYHLAADITLSSSYMAIREVNTLSLRNVLELCLRTRYKYLYYASSMGVFPQYFFSFAHEFKRSRIQHQMQPDLTRMKRMFPIGLLGYPWSKLVSEQILLFAQQAGMLLAVFRLPQTGLSSSGYTPAHDLSIKILAAVGEIGIMPKGFSFRSSNEVVDTVARICVAISLNASRRFTIYHCCNPELDHHDLEPADFGLYWPEVSYEAFKRACQVHGQRSPLHGHWAVLDHFGKYWFSRNKPVDQLPMCDRAIREDCPFPIKWMGPLTKLRRSHRWIRAHREDWPYTVHQSSLDFDGLISRAEQYARDEGAAFESVYPAWMREGLGQLVQALQEPGVRLQQDRLADTVYSLSRFLRGNAALAGERLRHPEIDRENVVRPVFIVGINRTGTTYLHRLLARDPRFWALRQYEYIEPVLPDGDYAGIGGTPADPRRIRTEEIFRASRFAEVFAGIHDFDMDEPEEDYPIFRMTFTSWVFLAQFPIPGYARWLAERGGCREAYDFHRRTMQHFNWQRRQRSPEHSGQWLLKMPFHLMELDTLMATYPDALFIQTHREPRQFMGSWNSLVERIRSLNSDRVIRSEVGAEQLSLMSRMLDRGTRFRESHPELEPRWVDVNYHELVRDPIAVVEAIYGRFGWSLTGAAANEMTGWLDQQAERRRQETRHRYTLEDYGLTHARVDAAFAGYAKFLATRNYVHDVKPTPSARRDTI